MTDKIGYTRKGRRGRTADQEPTESTLLSHAVAEGLVAGMAQAERTKLSSRCYRRGGPCLYRRRGYHRNRKNSARPFLLMVCNGSRIPR